MGLAGWDWSGELPPESSSERQLWGILTVSEEQGKLQLAGLLCDAATGDCMGLGPIWETDFLVKKDFKDSPLSSLRSALLGKTDQNFKISVSAEKFVLQLRVPALGLSIPVAAAPVHRTQADGRSGTADAFTQTASVLSRTSTTLKNTLDETALLKEQLAELHSLVEVAVRERDNAESRMLSKFMFMINKRGDFPYLKDDVLAAVQPGGLAAQAASPPGAPNDEAESSDNDSSYN